MKKTAEKRRGKALLLVGLMLLIMGLAFSFRVLVNQRVSGELGAAYTDPETGMPYLTEMDSYYHLRMTRDIENTGHAGETIRNGEAWDALSYAPDGRTAGDYRPLLAYLTIGAHRLVSLFGSVSLEQVAYWMGAVLSTLAVIPVFLFVYRLKGMLAAVVASILAAINYGYFIHTVPGFFDTDSVILWTSCSVFLTGCLLIQSLYPTGEELLRQGTGRSWVRIAVYGALFAGSLLLLAASWYIYYLFAGILAAAALGYGLLSLFRTPKKDRKKALKDLIPLTVFIAATGAVILIASPDLIPSMAGTLRDVFSNGSGSLFPNALVSVGEMRKPSLIAGGLAGLFQMRVLTESDIGIINAVGGIVPFLGAAAMWVLLILRAVRRKFRPESILLILWFPITAFLAFRSWRFIMLFAVPVAILAGMMTGTLAEEMRKRKLMDHQIFSGMIAVLMIFPAVYGAYRSSGDSTPIVNRSLHAAMTFLRDQTPENTIAAGWWDYGYFIEEKAQRRTLFDGGSQNRGERVYWVAKALASDDERLSRNILRMLAGSGDRGTDRMLEAFGENRETLAWMGKLLAGGKDAAAAALAEKSDPETAAELLSLLFPDSDDPVVCLVTAGMPRIAGWFAQFGYDDDERYAGNGYSVVMDRGAYIENKGAAGWRIGSVNGNEIRLITENRDGGFRAYTQWAGMPDAGQPYPVERVIVIRDGMLTEYNMGKVAQEGVTGFTAVLELDSENPCCSLMSSLMADSVFGKLYYLRGAGMEEFYPTAGAGNSARLYRLKD